MLGGSAGQFVVGPWIEEGMHIDIFWLSIGIFTIIVAFGLWFVTPVDITEKKTESVVKKQGILEPYKIVFSNPQSWFCGIISGLLFAPTTIFAMTWAVDFFQKDRALDFHTATISSAMVAFGWVFGCPLLGYITDKLKRRKPVLVAGALLMIITLIQLLYFPDILTIKYSMFLLGVASGAAMIPYSIIKEANPDNVKGSATGAINFITFGVTTLLSPLFSRLFGQTLNNTLDKALHFQQAGLFWIIGIAIAILISFLLKETGEGKHANSTKVVI